jgi:magnesium transporter
MITFYSVDDPDGVALTSGAECPQLTASAVWIDLLEPTQEEEQTLERALGIDIPTREEMQAIELSSRLYEENGILYLTATVLINADTRAPESSAVTFILIADRLVTLRYADPAPFRAFRKRRATNPQRYDTALKVLGGILDAIVERIADILEGVGTHLDAVSTKVFEPQLPEAMRLHQRIGHSRHARSRRQRQRGFVEVLRHIGMISDLVSRARESLVSFTRLVTFFREVRRDSLADREAAAHIETIVGDLGALSDHVSFLSTKVSFLLDATLGMIGNEQNAIIRALSVAALIFLPPTLVAGVYGMNFDFMPELKWVHGYPFALTLMLIAAVLPYLFFKRKGWL